MRAKILAILTSALCIFVMGGATSTNFAWAVDEKTTVSVTDSSPWFSKGSNSGHPEYWRAYASDEYNYIWTYVGGMVGNSSQPDCWAEFRPYFSQAEEYDLYACFYADPQNSRIVPYTIYHQGGSETVQVDEYASNYFTWKEVYLGRYNFNAGSNTRVVVTDATGETYDGLTTLNVDTVKFVKTDAPKPDLIVENASVSPNPPVAGESTTVGIRIKNIGEANITGTFFLEHYFDTTYIGHVYVNGLDAGSTHTSYWQAQIWPSDTNSHTIKGVVDPDNAIPESLDNNNELSKQFTAVVALPGVSTSSASIVSPTSATLNGRLESTGGESCQVWFEWGLTTSYGQSTAKQSRSSTGSFNADVSGLASGATYHVRACASNTKGSVYGFDNTFIPSQPGNRPPDFPTNLVQLKSDIATQIPLGSITSERTVFFESGLSDPDGDKVKLQIELRRLDEFGGSFLDRFTQESSLISGSQVSVGAYGLVNGDYHWQARTVDEYGLASAWVDFGNNPDLATDFSVTADETPFATFTYSPKYPEIGEEITFDGSSSYDPDGGTISCGWDFGDGNTASGLQVTHTYSATGSRTVTLTVTDDEGTVSEYSVHIGIFSPQLEDAIGDIVNDAKTLLDELSSKAEDVADAVDYLSQEFIAEHFSLLTDLAFGLTGKLRILKVRKISALSIADSTKLPTYLADLINTTGWIVAGVTKEALSEGLEAVATDVLNRLLANAFSYSTTLPIDLTAKNVERQNSLVALKNETLNNIGSLTQAEINMYKDDIQKRSIGNLLLADIYSKKTLLPATFKDIKEYLGPSKAFLRIGMIPGKVALMALGPSGQFIYWGFKTVSVAVQIAELKEDESVSLTAMQILYESFLPSDLISRNTHQALLNINSKTTPLNIQGKIISIENFGAGPLFPEPVHYNKYLSFMYKDVFSVVEVKNEGDLQATFELATLYYKKFFTGLGGMREIPVVYTDNKEIETGQTEMFVVHYMKDAEGIDPKNQLVLFNLFAENNGIYGLDTDSTLFGTTKIVTNDVAVSKEELQKAGMYHYPVRSEVKESTNTSTLDIYLENPFDFSAPVNLIQEIPSDVSVISVSNGLVSGDGNIFWHLELDGKEPEILTVTLDTSRIVSVSEIPGAMLKVYDQVNDSWHEFVSNDVIIEMPSNLMDTGWKSPGANGWRANTWSSPENVYSSNDQYAAATGRNKDHYWYNFGFNVPSGVIIKGIEFKLEGMGDGVDYVGKVKVRVFRRGVALNETDYLEFPAAEEAIHTVGGPSDVWGYIRNFWKPEDFNDNTIPTFAVRVTTGPDWHIARLDNIQAKVYYTEAGPPPVVTTINPDKGQISDYVTIKGMNFGSTQSSSHAKFYYDRTPVIISWSDASIVCAVPAGAETGPVTVVTGSGTSNSLIFTVNSPPGLEWTGEAGYEGDGLDPEIGYDSDLFTFRIKYKDADGNQPVIYRVYIDKNGDGDYSNPGEINDMIAAGTDYAQGVIYSYTTTVPYSSESRNCSYYFEFSDGIDSAAGNITRAISKETAINRPDVFLETPASKTVAITITVTED